ncbi:MAG: FliH/SctL family protein [Fibrobacterota bacterium]
MKDDRQSLMNSLLLDAAKKALGTEAVTLFPKSAVRKADPTRAYSGYDLTLGQFYVPGRTPREMAATEEKMIVGLKVLVDKLQKENAALRQQVVKERETVFRKGLAEGQKKGCEEGRQAGKAEMQKSISAVQGKITQVLKSFEAQKDAVLNKSERKSLEIIFLAVEKIIRREAAATGRDVTLNILKAAIAEVAKADTVTVRVNPADVQAVELGRAFWLPITVQIKEIRIQEDSRIESGGCILDSPSGSVDARLSTQLEKIKEVFLKCWEEGMGAVT